MSLAETYHYVEQIDERTDSTSPHKRLLEKTPALETENGVRIYDLLCLASKDPLTGEEIIVRKAHQADSADPTAWLPVRHKTRTNETIYNQVYSAHTEYRESGDIITLTLIPDVAHHGMFTLTFSVDSLYRPDGNPATLEHLKYYGRAFDEYQKPEMYQDAAYTNPLDVGIGMVEHLAPVISLDAERTRRRPLGYVAVTGSQAQ